MRESDLTVVVDGRSLTVLAAPGRAEGGPWTVLAAAHHRSQRAAEAGHAALVAGRPLESALPPMSAVLLAHRSDTGEVEAVTSTSAGALLAHAALPGGGHLLGTSLTRLLDLLPEEPELDLDRLREFVRRRRMPGPPYRGVEGLRRGHRLRWVPGGAWHESTWYAMPDADPLPVDEVVERYVVALDGALRVELPDGGDVSALMSAGLDSTMVVASAAGLMGPDRRIDAMCFDPWPPLTDDTVRPSWRYSDLPDARAMQGRWPNVRVLPLGHDPATSPADALRAVFDSTALPALSPANFVLIRGAIDRARALGHPLILTGQSGNFTFSHGSVWTLWALAARGRPGALIDSFRARTRALGLPPWQVARDLLRPVKWRLVERDRLGPSSPGFYARGFAMAAPDQPRLVDPLAAQPLLDLIALAPPEAFVGVGADRSFARRCMDGRVPDSIRLRAQRGSQGADAYRWWQHDRAREQAREALAEPDLPAVVPAAWLTPPEGMPPDQLAWLGHERAIGMGLFLRWHRERRATRRAGG